jgi:hypothetical protein
MLGWGYRLRIDHREAAKEKDADYLKHLYDSIPLWPSYFEPRDILGFRFDKMGCLIIPVHEPIYDFLNQEVEVRTQQKRG